MQRCLTSAWNTNHNKNRMARFEKDSKYQNTKEIEKWGTIWLVLFVISLQSALPFTISVNGLKHHRAVYFESTRFILQLICCPGVAVARMLTNAYTHLRSAFGDEFLTFLLKNDKENGDLAINMSFLLCGQRSPGHSSWWLIFERWMDRWMELLVAF